MHANGTCAHCLHFSRQYAALVSGTKPLLESDMLLISPESAMHFRAARAMRWASTFSQCRQGAPRHVRATRAINFLIK